MGNYADWAARWRVPLHFLLAVVLLVLAQPMPRLLGGGGVLVATGLAVRAWSAGHLRREELLTVSGPYAHVRHPLYVGSALIGVGFAVASGSWLLAAALVLYAALLFVPVIEREEGERAARAPEGYAAYAAAVPKFLPRLTPADLGGASQARFDPSLYRRNREWRALAGCALLLALLSAKMLWK